MAGESCLTQITHLGNFMFNLVSICFYLARVVAVREISDSTILTWPLHSVYDTILIATLR